MTPEKLAALRERYSRSEWLSMWEAPGDPSVIVLLDAFEAPRDAIDAEHLARQRAWSETTFGPGPRTLGVIDHIRKELDEIAADPTDLGEWVDVIILALDGAWRCGAEPQQIIDAIVAKQTRNKQRSWPDWRSQPQDTAIEHLR